MKIFLIAGGFMITLCLNLACSPIPTRDLSSNPILDCTDGPHCVTTQTQNIDRKIEPFIFNGKNEDFQKIAVRTINLMPRSQVIRSEKNYIYAEITSALLHFVDDFEVYLDQQTHMVHLRSCSRIGYADLGVNRQRAEKFKELLLK